jgi:hypothetical protein
VDSSPPPSSERRRTIRHIACFPAYVEHDGKTDKIIAMIADLAETGTLLMLRRPDLRVDDELKLELYIALDGSTSRTAMGRVVRIEPLPEGRTSLWTHQIGVEFHAPIALGAPEIESLEKREAVFGRR